MINEQAHLQSDMNCPAIVGVGILPVGEHWAISLRNLAGRAIRLALGEAGNLKPDAIYIGNCLGSVLSHQANLGAAIAESAGYSGIESYTVEAAGASGAAAFRAACQAVKSGFSDVAVAVGVEKVTECEGSHAETALNLALNYEFETSQGMTALTQAALLARRYLHVHALDRSVLKTAAVNSFQNARENANAMFRAINSDRYDRQQIVADPLGMLDIAFSADGAAAVVVTRAEAAASSAKAKPVFVRGSGAATAPLSIHDRPDLLRMDASRISAAAALRQAGLNLSDIDAFELWDATSIELILSLEALGLREEGRGWQLDNLELNLSGGCLGRGNPLGASALYQIAESAQRLRTSEETVLVQALGSCGATAITHVLSS